ncbi:hypothetical protein [Fodinicola feengrottensis]|nr:hypothetical protein [Fodinicola feengrottensis]
MWRKAPKDTSEYLDAQKEYFAACDECDEFLAKAALRYDAPELAPYRAKVELALEAMRAEEVWCHRLNVWGGASMSSIMEALGMGFWQPNEPDLPDLPDGMTWDEPDFDEEENPLSDRAKAYMAASDKVLAAHCGEIPGIPLHKIAGTNDGWVVTSVEIRAALTILDSTAEARIADAFAEYAWSDDPVRSRTWFDSWVRFLRDAAELGNGFVTY